MPGSTDCKQCQIDPCAIDSAKVKKTAVPTTAYCLIDTHAHALAARAMRLSLAAMGFADALFMSNSDGNTGGSHHVAIASLVGRAVYSYFITKDLLRHVDTAHDLLIQWDGYVVNPNAWGNDFLDHDYIGVRWEFHKDVHCVGNGRLSLRSWRLLEALQDPAIDRFEPEDEMICRHYRPLLESCHGISFTPPEGANRFSFETTYPQGKIMGFHGLFNIWQFVSDEEVPDFVAAMPGPILGPIQLLSLAKGSSISGESIRREYRCSNSSAFSPPMPNAPRCRKC